MGVSRFPEGRAGRLRAEHGVTRRAMRRVEPANRPGRSQTDELVVEEPLEIRVAGDPLAVTMRTPGEDHDLALGFLFAEGVIAGTADVGTIAHCGRPGEEGWGNVIDVSPGPGVVLDPERLAQSRRGTLTTAACGVCGRRSIDDLLARTGTLPAGPTVPWEVLSGCTARLEEVQDNFSRTGGIHAAAAMDASGAILAAAEDVGRHNAVDKVLGAALRRDLLAVGHAGGLRATLLVVSGRISFEILQKAAVAGIPVVAGVSAPTSLAVDLAERSNVTLAGFVRRGALNLYTHPERVTDLDAPARVSG